MIKIAVFLDNRHIPSVDFRNPKLGNPGTGACEYLHVAIPYFLHEYCRDNIKPIILAPHIAQLPPELEAYQVFSVTEAASKAKELGARYFVFRPRQAEEENILDHIDKIQMPSIGRAALTPHAPHMRKMASSRYFKSLVCVGREQYDFLIDTPLKPKLAYIDNGVHIDSCWMDSSDEVKKDPRLVVFMGALVPVKGFHQLAEAWPKVLRQFPDAKLSVIGSVKMYGDDLSVGPLGVADGHYEREHIIPHLCDDQGRIHPSVTFHGQMGRGKYDLIRKAAVGVVNPTGQTETCCVSAVEMSACKTPVVTGAYYALLDTVLHNQTGLLGRGVDDLARNICACLADPALIKKLGEGGYQRARSQYDFSAVAPRWVALFEALRTDQTPTPPGKIQNIRYHFKALRLINYIFQSSVGKYMFWPSVFEAQVWAHSILKRIKSLKEQR